MSDSVRPQRWQPTRLRRPWDSPGKNTGVGCHFLLQCMKVKSENAVTQSCLTPSNPMDCSLPGSSIHGILQARVLEWGAIASYIQINANMACRENKSFNTEKIQSKSVIRIIMLIKNLLYLRSTQRCMPASNRVKLLVERRKLG